jgi:hypothetical protein
LDPIKKAIRNALEKGDPTDEAFRERVYRSAFASLERALSGRESLTPEQIEERRSRLRASIVEIESEFAPALPEFDAELPDQFIASPSLRADDRLDPAATDTRKKDARRRRKRSRLGMLFLIAAAGFVAMALVAWWILFGGYLAPERNAPPSVRDGASTGSAPVQNWVVIFTPDDPTSVALSGGATAQVMAEEGQAFLRLGGGGQASFDVGQGILEQMAGRRVMLSIVARAASEEPVGIAVECRLAELGDCGRKRFELGPSMTEFLFEIDVPAGDPRQAGSVVMQPGIGGASAAIDIQEIRMATVVP